MKIKKRVHVALIFGGRSGEHEVSLMSARSVLAVLDPNRYQVTAVGITHAGAWFSGENVLAALAAGTTEGLTPVTLLPFPGQEILYSLRDGRCEPLAPIDVAFPLLHGS